MREVLSRIVNSKKTVLALIPMLITVGGVVGLDMELFQGSILDVVNGFFAILVGAQTALDVRHGSPSDGTLVE